ncbi:ankyrin repeat domain-containing protein [Streptomyces venezuelae]|uniref:Ankyrin repeat domain-containing protein n=1 Tax=Streptomyces venezuelae TaxID=54571 RepID=A0A5P2C6N5_STRVZ|nr:ankyrin repeat domain-containing protein [Streptomyces venezuelae]QES38435.1 ankyrin repeat domain-containing protein [Streptomyces venezuelae]
MGFFDDLVYPAGERLDDVSDEPSEGPSGAPAEGRGEAIRLGPPGEDAARERPPLDWFAPASVPQPAVAGAGPTVKVLLTGWSVWPGSVTLHLAVHRTVHRQHEGRPDQSGLRVGLLLGDGRRVTSLDTDGANSTRVLGPAARLAAVQSGKPTGLIPLDSGGMRDSLFRTDVDLYLPELPPPGEARLVVEWPDEDVPETSTPVDADALRAASTRAVEVWPGLPTPRATGDRFLVFGRWGGPPGFLARPMSAHELGVLRDREEARQRYVPRADWEGIGYEGWCDAALIRARLDGGASADADVWSGRTPLHLAAERGGAESLRLLLPHVTDIDAPDREGHTALWHATCAGDEECVRTLIGAGADVWTPQTGPWSPGRLLLTTPLAPVVAELPGAVALPDEELAAFRAADALVAAFTDANRWTEGLGVAFVRGLGGAEVVRRLGADPALCPEILPKDASFEEDDGFAEDDGTDADDWEDEDGCDRALRFVSVTEVPGDPGGCVITQDGYLPSDETLLGAISAGTTAFGLYFNPKGGTHGTLARDGRCVEHEEVGLSPEATDPSAYWRFRFWQTGPGVPYDARELAYACAAAGLRVSDGCAALDGTAPRRRVELPVELVR